ncbi:MAG: endonuclease III [Ignavibacteria bacterium RIFOXYB2_FULL_35_12]|nr:MAG: endonuclease III [Ignavibacteria bacterium GWA2_36_19]OGU58784.1 MAG: endonuclease III [Ignavibacteria bacterium GWF2_35_20]OGU91332.1 MAG: endonuclease III [Ignavibacteria bacterium RIFOXYA12_FULL_35_25]OGU94411.1 MAG: endonuclease III [Ignavibacteria bacterium RIFOXYB12_FULL_35_14]OGU98384.1 MAG: endonuclease III [Ignavibacteria bacterium RIFOXYC2_FULL_35_16]OGV01909.1 MAG: endonuclease III [Ignavibacteria bacterium RIFOXYB2_FULL_35_12]OGV29926.1 MAG: endonuclease III [Ignavibacteri
MKSLINKINKILISKFGVPNRNAAEMDPVDVLIATILSQNTTDKNSYKAYKNLKANFKNWNEVASAKQKTIEQNIRIGGLAKQKAKSIKIILNELLKQKGKVTLDYLKKLPNDEVVSELVKFNGVGVKTASCVLLFSLNRDVCPVDTHVHRTANRIGLVKTKSPEKTFELLNKNLPAGAAHSFHTNLIKLGRDICKSGRPLCTICPLFKICTYAEKNMHSISKVTKNDFLLLDNV